MALGNNNSKLKQSACPPCIVCPLSYRVMENPFFDACGHSFEQSAIESWVLHHGNCPISRKAMTLEDLRPNYALAERIDKYKWQSDHADVTVLKSTSDEDESTTVEDAIIIRDNGDIEMGGHVVPKTGFKKQYEKVSTEMTLLPQEREVLEVIRRRNDIIKLRRRRRKCCYCFLAAVGVVVFAVVIGVYWASY